MVCRTCDTSHDATGPYLAAAAGLCRKSALCLPPPSSQNAATASRIVSFVSLRKAPVGGCWASGCGSGSGSSGRCSGSGCWSSAGGGCGASAAGCSRQSAASARSFEARARAASHA